LAARASQDGCHPGANQQHRHETWRRSIFAGVGERSREGNDLYKEMSEAGVIDQKDLSKSKVGMVFGQMTNHRARVYGLLFLPCNDRIFRDERNQDVLLSSTTSFDSRKRARRYRHCWPNAERGWLPTYAGC